MKEFLETMEIQGAENLAARLVYAVWIAHDHKDPLWKSAGAQVYDRLESRVRQAARVTTMQDFVALLCRRCHVAVPRLEPVDQTDLRTAEPGEVLRLLRENSGLVISAMRLWADERRAQAKPAASPLQDQLFPPSGGVS